MLKKVFNRLVKNVLQLSFFSQPATIAYLNKVEKHKRHLQDISIDDLEIITRVEREGVFVSSLDELKITNTKVLLDCCYKVLPELMSQIPKNKRQFYICNSSINSPEHTNIFLWGLDPRLLNLVERYLGLPPAYHGIYLRRDLANNVVRKSRLWHIDKEDRRMLKIIIYLNNVDDRNGAFQYIHKYNTEKVFQSLNYRHEYIKDEKISTVIPKSSWISCAGQAGTVIFVDTAAVFHRGQKPIRSDRLALFFDYTSSYPLRPYYCKSSFSVRDLLNLSARISARQKKYVFWNRRLMSKLIEFEANYSNR